MLIGIGGGFCSGKSSIAEKIGDKVFNFADKLKDTAIDLFGMDPNEKDRTLLQELGFKMREIRKSVWVDYVMKKAMPYVSIYKVCIADVRYENELDIIKKNNGITIYIDTPIEIRLERYKKLYGKYPTEEQINHESELLDKDLFDYIIDGNKPFDEVISEINNIINTHG